MRSSERKVGIIDTKKEEERRIELVIVTNDLPGLAR